MDSVKRNRLIADYYEAVIQGKPAMTIEDIKLVEGTLKVGLSFLDQKIDSLTSFKEESEYDKRGRRNILEIALKNFPEIQK